MNALSTPASMGELAHMGTYESAADILSAFRPVMHAMAAAAGPDCEVVLHDLSAPDPDLSYTIAAIENGHVTGREVDGPSTSLGIGMLHDQGADHNAFGYRGFTSDGRQLRCSSVYFRNSAGRIIALTRAIHCYRKDTSGVHPAINTADLKSDRPDVPPHSPSEFRAAILSWCSTCSTSVRSTDFPTTARVATFIRSTDAFSVKGALMVNSTICM
jgi:hypothetical protein